MGGNERNEQSLAATSGGGACIYTIHYSLIRELMKTSSSVHREEIKEIYAHCNNVYYNKYE